MIPLADASLAADLGKKLKAAEELRVNIKASKNFTLQGFAGGAIPVAEFRTNELLTKDAANRSLKKALVAVIEDHISALTITLHRLGVDPSLGVEPKDEANDA